MGPIWALFGIWPFSGHKNYIVSKLWNLQFVWFEIWQVFLWLWYLNGDRVLNSKFWPKMGIWEWGNFGSQKVRSAINGTIFNRSASNLVCTHYYLVSTPAKLKNSLWNRAPFRVLTLLRAPKLRGLITMEPNVLDIYNFAGACSLMMSKMWRGQISNFCP